MPNVNYHVHVLCPYFQTDKKMSISCEDTFRTYESEESKLAWMGMYCDSWEWEKCPYAVDMTEAYYRQEKGDSEAVEKHKTEALEKELKSMSKRLGRCLKRNEQLQKVNKVMHTKMDRAIRQLEEYKQHEAQRYFDLASIYEARIAYLIDTYCDGRLPEADVIAWAEGKEFALTYDQDSEERIWVVQTREAGAVDDVKQDVSESVQRAAEDERRKTEE